MSYQPQISMISGTAPPSYMEAIGQTPPQPKDGFPVPPTMPQPYGSYVQPPPMGGGQYSTISANYREYNPTQPSYNPMFVPPAPAPDTTQPVQRPCVVTTIVRRKRNGTCLSCVRMITLTILILIAVSYLLKVIIASTSH